MRYINTASTRLILWLDGQRIRVTAWRHTRRMFHRGHLTPKARRALSAAAKRRTP
jgi:hypothetical protein